jgi:hypothetical protein
MTVRRLVIGGLLALAILAVPLQVIIDPSIQNVASACLVLASSMGILLYIGWTDAMQIQPLSTFALLGFCVTTQLGALLAQTAAWTALRSSLYDPLYTFGTLAFYQAIAIAVHATYTFLLMSKQPGIAPVRWILDGAGLYRIPEPGVLWIMGVIGLASFGFYGKAGVVSKVMDAFHLLTWAPFLIPIYLQEAGPAYCNARKMAPFIILFALAICLLGMAVNARGIMFFGAVTIGLAYLVIGLRSTAPAHVSRPVLLKIAVLAVAGIALAGPVADLATAMAIARAHRGKISPVEMIANTFDAWRNPYLIAQYRAYDKAAVRTAYDENYIANPMVARFVETKFHDNSLHFAGMLTSDDSIARLRSVSIASLWAILPAPIINALHVSVDKGDLNFSMGDYLVYLSRGLPLGGRKTGSIFAEGMVLLGPLFPILYAGLCLVTYKIMDLLTVRPAVGMASISAVGKILAWGLFIYGVTGESINAMVIFVVRQVWQDMLIYLSVLSIARLLLHRSTASGGDSAALDGTYGR